MKLIVLKETGFDEALLGLSLNKKQDVTGMPRIAKILSSKDGGHNKFLESIIVWIDMSAPRGFWQQFDTYRIGVTKQSESTMHTILKHEITQNNFQIPIYEPTLTRLNQLREKKEFHQLKNELPEGYLQRRIITTNYKTLRNIIQQRKTHRLKEWQVFCGIVDQLEYADYLGL